MEFGKLNDLRQLDHIAWDLPTADPGQQAFWKALPRKEKQRAWLGAPAWGRKEWLGRLYPAKTKASDYLFHYSRYFNCIELNTSHYRIPTPEQVRKWKDQVPADFAFCPKVFQGISHDRGGLENREFLQEWFHFLKALESHRGPCFLQLPPTFDYTAKARLFHFLERWPTEWPLALEFRHPSWFQDGHLREALCDYLRTRGVGLVITDVAGRRDVLHTCITAPFTLIRFIGNDLHTTDFQRAQLWNQQCETWRSKGLSDVYFFVHQPDDFKTPEMSEFFLSLSFFSGLKKSQSSPSDPSQLSF